MSYCSSHFSWVVAHGCVMQKVPKSCSVPTLFIFTFRITSFIHWPLEESLPWFSTTTFTFMGFANSPRRDSESIEAAFLSPDLPSPWRLTRTVLQPSNAAASIHFL